MTSSIPCLRARPGMPTSSISASTRRPPHPPRRDGWRRSGDQTGGVIAGGKTKKPARSCRAGFDGSGGWFWWNEGVSVQLLPDFVDALGQEIVGDLALDRLRENGRGRRDGCIGGCGADVGHGLRLGEGDLALGGLGAAGDEN